MSSTITLEAQHNDSQIAGPAGRDSAKPPREPIADALNARLEQIERFLRAQNGSAVSAAQSVHELRQRLAAGRLHLAVLGQFKRGKSTLLNALVGCEILPTAVVPLTAVPTFLRFADELSLRTSYADGRTEERHPCSGVEQLRERLAALVTETGNPQNRLGISRVEAFLPSALLQRGVVLIDTPGIGSTLRHNTEATLAFLPQCDAALFVLSADPPITEAEAQFLKAVQQKVRELFFIINKVDYLNAEELAQTRNFVREVLSQKAGIDPDARLFCASARWGLQARRSGDQRLWEESGLRAVEERLIAFLAEEKHKTLADAVCARTLAIMEEASLGMELAARAWQLPLEELEGKAAAFSAKAEELRREADRSGDLLDGDQRRLQQKLEQHAEQLRLRARAFLFERVNRKAEEAAELSEQALRESLAEAIPGFFDREMASSVEAFRKELDGVLEPHRRRAAQLVRSLQETASELFEVPVGAFGAEESLRIFEEPYWVTSSWDSALHPIPTALSDRLLPPSRRKARLLHRLSEQIDELIMRNVENLRWSILQSLNRSFLANKPRVRERFSELLGAAQEAVQRTLEKRRAIQQASTGELKRQQEALHELRRLQGLIVEAQESMNPAGR